MQYRRASKRAHISGKNKITPSTLDAESLNSSLPHISCSISNIVTAPDEHITDLSMKRNH